LSQSRESRFADAVFVNARIWVGDGSGSVVSGLAVRDGRILAAGSDDDVVRMARRPSDVEDLGGAFVMPGFIDSHTHAPGTALADLYDVSLYTCKSPDSVLRAVRKFIRENPDSEEVRGAGWDIAGFSDKELVHGPRKGRLDDVSSTLPIILQSYDGHTLWLNSAAFTRYGITSRTPDPSGGVIERDPHSGSLWGTLKEEAVKLVPRRSYAPHQYSRALRLYQSRMHRLGITGVMSIFGAGLGAPAEVFAALEDEDGLSLRVNYAHEISPQSDLRAQFEALTALKAGCDRERFRVTSAKFFADGVVEGGTAFMKAPYAAKVGNESDENNAAVWGLKELTAAYRAARRSGFQIFTHTIGDASTRRVLNALRAAGASAWRDARPVLTHLQVTGAREIARMARMGVVASIQPFWHMKEPNWWRRVDATMLGIARANREYPLRSLFDAGICVASSSDHPITADPNPWVALEIGVTRNLADAKRYGVRDITRMDDKRYLLGKGQRVDIERMLLSYTRNGAFLLGREDECGTLAPGLKADFIVVDRDPRAVDPVDIESCLVNRTYFAGRLVWDRAVEE